MSVPFDDLIRRFHGFDLQYRHHGTGWPGPWRARIVTTKNERSEYRVAGYGITPVDALKALRALVESVDKEALVSHLWRVWSMFGGEVWCGAKRVAGAVMDGDVSMVTCELCLGLASEFGGAAHHRLRELKDGAK